MKIAVIIHSKTGKTLKAGKSLAEKLKTKGHTVDVVELKTDPLVNTGSARSHRKFIITNLPDCSIYDAVVVGGPVWAFSASPVIYEAVKAFKGLKGKKTAVFVTHGLPFAFMGGKQSARLLAKELINKGANIVLEKTIPNMNLDKNIEKTASEIAAMF